MGEKKVQTSPSDAIIRAEQAVKKLEAQYNKAGFEANKVNAVHQEKAAHGDAAAKQAIDEAQKKREAAQKALKEAQTRLNALKSGKQPQEKSPAPKQAPVKKKDPVPAKDPKTPPKRGPAPAQEPVKIVTRELETLFGGESARRSDWFERLMSEYRSESMRVLSESMRVLVEKPVCRPTPKPQGSVDPKNSAKPQGSVDPKKTKEAPPPRPSSLESSLDFYCGKN